MHDAKRECGEQASASARAREFQQIIKKLFISSFRCFCFVPNGGGDGDDVHIRVTRARLRQPIRASFTGCDGISKLQSVVARTLLLDFAICFRPSSLRRRNVLVC